MKQPLQSLRMVLLLTVLAMPATLLAQVLTPRAPGGLKPSVYWLPEFKAAEAAGQPAGATVFAAPQSNWRVGVALAPRWDVQIGLSPNNLPDRLARQRQALFGADALYLFGASDLRPFLLLGLGAQRELRSADDPAARAVDRAVPFVNAGFGLQYRWSNSLGLQADVRRVHGMARDPLAGPGLRGSESAVNFGLTWLFGAAH